MNLQLDGARVLVTAGASGIGLATARAFVREGARVHDCDVDRGALDALAASEPTVTRSLCDVADRAAVAHLFDDALDALGGLDALVNNAGIAGPTAPCEDIAPEDWERTLAVNITGQFHCAQRAIPHLRRSKNASIANLSSAAGRFGFPLRTPYAASKWAVIGFTKTLSIELGADGIRVNAICPAYTRTPMLTRMLERSPDLEAKLISRIPLRRLGTAEEIAQAAIYLFSDAAAFITGHSLVMDGGIVAE